LTAIFFDLVDQAISLKVSTQCWMQLGRAEVREAAYVHLGLLREKVTGKQPT
jgi:hypothetical protein